MDERIIHAVREDGLRPHLKSIFISCYDQIITRKVTTVAELMDYLGDIVWCESIEKIARKCFRLIRELNWGVFRELDKEHFPKLWRSLVIPDRRMRDVGDLKRSIQVPNTYCALMDIHAYTEFCRRHRHNFSMLNVLDTVIQKDIRDIARKNECISYRSAGDNILLIGTSARDIIHACLGIVDCFSRRRVIKSSRLAESRKGKSIVLQDIHVAGGIAGGQNYSSMVVTADGDVSGSIVNTAARLQGFANFLSPAHSKVMTSSHVRSGYLRETRGVSGTSNEAFSFFSCGRIHFKGVGLQVHEILYTDNDHHKLSYQKEFRRMLQTMERGGWKENLVPDVVSVVIAVLRTVPVSKLEFVFDGEKKLYNTETIIGLAEYAATSYRDERDHLHVNERLQKLLSIVELVNGFDRLVLLHLRQVVDLFNQMTVEYEAIQREKILANQSGLFSQKEKKILSDTERFVRAREKLIERSKMNNNIYSSAMLWNKVISDYERSWEFQIYSGKL